MYFAPAVLCLAAAVQKKQMTKLISAWSGKENKEGGVDKKVIQEAD